MTDAAKPNPLDLGCGTLVPVRWSKLCVVYKYDHNGSCAPNVVEDKPFEMHVLVQTTRGRWYFQGKKGGQEVDSSLLVAGVQGDHYGCRHDRRYGDSNLIASLRRDALDQDDEPLFGRQTLPAAVAPALERAIGAETEDMFDSRVFEIFDRVSIASLRATRSGRSSSLRMQRAKRFIEAHAFEDLALADVASCLNLSPFSCLRQFKASTGLTPHAYMSSRRLQRAQQLLKDSALSISNVGASVGIRDQCYFARWFARETGMAPGQFRKNLRR
ncbi:MAG: AraC family transcriptional regulator [Candidatus Eremiobacteraeota bacterium]|nr:AraC family transcriptional regulator [Candidatus Eremiobacteraeota bacterium]